jgi:hypothetical protein
MDINNDWPPLILLKSPLFKPLQHVLAQLGGENFPGLEEWNALIARNYPELTVNNGYPLRFVPQETGRQGFESQYEPRCYLSGEVQTRENNWHDLFNALVWLTFPKAKAAINERHYLALMRKHQPGESQRGKVRDMATLLDESGVIVVSDKAELIDSLYAFQWKELFWGRRDETSISMDFYVFGHGLYEKALQPYIGMTGQGLVLRVESEFFTWTLSERLAYLDEHVADYLHMPEHCCSTRELHPVPLLGVPGWSAANELEAYYDNKAYFRTGRGASVK